MDEIASAAEYGNGHPRGVNNHGLGNGLASMKTSERLNQIDRVRALGVGNHIASPQLVREFDDFAELPGIIQEASRMMKLRSTEFLEGPAFATDVLRLEEVGNTGLHLTLVDLPGLISVGDGKDIQMVRSLVDNYLESSRTIILAVILATSDAETQPIIQRAQHFDKQGDRTIGIITKPDLINKGTEERVACLAKYQDRTQLQYGFFLLKNPSPEELKVGVTAAQRDKAESEFFSKAAWKAQGLDVSRVGIKNLRLFLPELLDKHIERELPKVREEIYRLLKRVEETIDHLGPKRSQAIQIRMFLTRVSSNFQSIIKGSLNGIYDLNEAELSSSKPGINLRLRAKVHLENERFADFMRMHSQQRKIVSDSDTDENTNASSFARYAADKLCYLAGMPDDKNDYEELTVMEEQMLDWVKEVYPQISIQEASANFHRCTISREFKIFQETIITTFCGICFTSNLSRGV
ncbi:Dynamin [Penicillium malachiteum]|nr:Dynamin [Penicillium malachiteum]